MKEESKRKELLNWGNLFICVHMQIGIFSLILVPLMFLAAVAMAVDVLHDVENVLLLYSSSATSPGHPSSNMVPFFYSSCAAWC